MNFRRVLITGAGGQLAYYVAQVFAESDVVALDRRALDITDPAAVARTVADASPDAIINCAAFNDVDGAEDRPEQALAVNAFAVRSLALAAERAGAVLVHYSTDFVFDGRRTSIPYMEQDEPSPRSLADQWGRAGWDAINYGRYASAAFDSLLAAAGNESEPARAAELYRRAMETLNDDAPAIFLYAPSNTAVVSRRLENVEIDPYSWASGLRTWSARGDKR